MVRYDIFDKIKVNDRGGFMGNKFKKISIETVSNGYVIRNQTDIGEYENEILAVAMNYDQIHQWLELNLSQVDKKRA